LLTGNAVQRILLFIGQPLAGKSTIAEVVEKIIGLINCTALRTAQLHERFEIGRLFGYTLLSAKDIPSDFLEQDGAQARKLLLAMTTSRASARALWKACRSTVTSIA
jgi:phage/plasmid-associated DNA primase